MQYLDVTHLPGLQSQAEQLGGIGGVGVKGKAFCLLRRGGIVEVSFIGVVSGVGFVGRLGDDGIIAGQPQTYQC